MTIFVILCVAGCDGDAGRSIGCHQSSGEDGWGVKQGRELLRPGYYLQGVCLMFRSHLLFYSYWIFI